MKKRDIKINGLRKIWLKVTDKKAYRAYKDQFHHLNTKYKQEDFVTANHPLTIDKILDLASNRPEINVIHSGNSGDIIYALPTIKKLQQIIDKPVNLLLKINVPMYVKPSYTHPLGNVMLNETVANQLLPLIKTQTYISDCRILTNDDVVDIDLNLFRDAGMFLDRGNIARWNFYTTGIISDLTQPWLNAKPDENYSNHIVVARSSRYNNHLIDYSFLSGYQNIIFIGVESEYIEMKKHIAELTWAPVKDFKQMAQIIAGAKLFIGNQSFPFSVAEGLKAKRILEVYYEAPNVVPEGPDGYEFFFQDHFEYLVKTLYN